ncbi:hypothetical protein SBOR_5873 [Sclerotinia borealis F-4128]|uniref:Uncharacterized protein n=1 Tax=Sclerotinia borealis (strain F-4128) TaxID=1432307 RepID=W9CCZ5_SCLBF|nr:hypothetical protein SBOR_5873 [Sclerotinia borealis F-4128]
MSEPRLMIVYRCSHELPDTNAYLERRKPEGSSKKPPFLNLFKRALSLGSGIVRRPCMDLCPACQAKERILAPTPPRAQAPRARPPRPPRPQPLRPQPPQEQAPQAPMPLQTPPTFDYMFQDVDSDDSDASDSSDASDASDVSLTDYQELTKLWDSLRNRMQESPKITPSLHSERRRPRSDTTFEITSERPRADSPNPFRIRVEQWTGKRPQEAIKRQIERTRNHWPPQTRSNTAPEFTSERPRADSLTPLHIRVEQWTGKKTQEAIKRQIERERNIRPPQLSPIRVHTPIHMADHSQPSGLISFPRFSTAYTNSPSPPLPSSPES